MELARFVESALQRTGCVAEIRDEDVLEALLPPPIAASLRLPEEARLRLRGSPSEGEWQAGYGSGLLAQLCSIAEGGVRRFRIELNPPLPKRERVEREAESVLSFTNAVGRVESFEEAALGYLVFDFRYWALSEERHEGLISVAVNVEGGWSPSLPATLSRFLSEHAEARKAWSATEGTPDPRPLYPAARALAGAAARVEAAPFVARMQRLDVRQLYPPERVGARILRHLRSRAVHIADRPPPLRLEPRYRQPLLLQPGCGRRGRVSPRPGPSPLGPLEGHERWLPHLALPGPG